MTLTPAQTVRSSTVERLHKPATSTRLTRRLSYRNGNVTSGERHGGWVATLGCAGQRICHHRGEQRVPLSGGVQIVKE
jgi:hypothetical protein